MKHIFTLGLFLLLTLKTFAQTDGISYQAVIIGPDVLELPGVNSEDNFLPVTDIAIRFVIFDSGNQIEYEEVQNTKTDEFGRVNLIIGAVQHDDFEKISWDGTPKDLKVEIDFNDGNGFIDMSREQLTFVPYAYHRNITAAGTLDVNDNTFLNGELEVREATNLYSVLSVHEENETNLSGPLYVGGTKDAPLEMPTILNGSLDVNNKSTTNLSGALNVGEATGVDDVDAPTVLNGTLNVVGKTTVTDFEATGSSTFNELTANTLEVITSSDLLGDTTINGTVSIESDSQITLNTTLSGSDRDITKYPVKIEGGNQGLAIVVEGSRTNGNNFISFWDKTAVTNPTTSGVQLTRASPNMWGRIEGETPGEFVNNADYNFDKTSLAFDIYDSEIDLGFAIASEVIAGAQVIKAATDFRGCVGLGGCLASPGPADIAFSAVELISTAAQVVFAGYVLDKAEGYERTYDANKLRYQGVTYASGAGDYAEYLLREKPNEAISFGDIVGIKGGKVSKNTNGAERMMVVSLKPIVLGNMPQSNEENKYEKVAFMGQVPVKVYGKVNIGDYIIPSGKNDGIGVAISPSKLTSNDIKGIVGIAWSTSDAAFGFNMVNTAVGLNKNDNNPIIENLEKIVAEQTIEINTLKNQIAEIHDLLSNQDENHNQKSSNSITKEGNDKEHYDDRKYEIIDTDKGEIVYWEVNKEDFEKGLAMAEEQMRADGIDLDNHVLWKKMKENPSFKNELLNKVKAKLDKQIHYHKTIDKKGGH